METNSICFSKVSNISHKKNKLKVCKDKVIIEASDGIIIREYCEDKYSIGVDPGLINQVNQNTQQIQEIRNIIDNQNGNEISGSTQVNGSSVIATLTTTNNTLCSVYVNLYAMNGGGQFGWKRVQFDHSTFNNATTVYAPSLLYSNGDLPIDVSVSSSGNQIPITVNTNAQVKWTIISNCKTF